MRGGGGNVAAGRSSKPDEMTTKMLVAASDKLWQSVLQGSAPLVISHPVEFQVSGSLHPRQRLCFWYLRRLTTNMLSNTLRLSAPRSAAGRPQALDNYDFDDFAKNLYRIKDEGDESPVRWC